MLYQSDFKSSTLSSPVAFFHSFILNGKLLEAMSLFTSRVPDRNDPEDIVARSCSYVSADKLEYHLEHTIETYNHNDDYVNTELITQVISFRKELSQLFYKEYRNSQEIIQAKVAALQKVKDSRKSSREVILAIYTKLLDCLTHITRGKQYRTYSEECVKPIEALIVFIYKKYPTLAPDQKIDKRIGQILLKSPSSKELYEKSTFRVGALSELISDLTEKINVFEDTGLASIEHLEGLLKEGTSYRYKGVINLTGRSCAIYYAISILLKYSRIIRKEIPSKKFLINGNPFDSKKCDRESSRYPKQHPKESTTIELIIQKYLV